LCHHLIHGYLSQQLPQRWVGRTAAEDQALLRWPLRSPNLTPCDFFFWEFVKNTFFLSPLPQDLSQLQRRHIAAISEIYHDLLPRVWAEMDYRLGVIRVTNGRYIQHL